MTTNIPSYPRHLRAVEVSARVSKRTETRCVNSLYVESREQGDLWIFVGLGDTETVLSLESCGDMHL